MVASLIASLALAGWADEIAIDQPQLSPLFADGMVVAENRPVRVFGTGKGEVRVMFRGHEARTTAAGEGAWCVELPAGEAGGPFELRVSLNGRERVIRDVHVGLVILFAGQSNMQFKLRESDTPCEQWRGDSRIRSFSTEMMEAGEPFAPTNGWVMLTRENAGRWSAIAYETATRIAAERKVAVGVVNCYQGASTIQAWMDPQESSKPCYRIPEGGVLHGDHTAPRYSRWNQPHGTLYRRQFRPLAPYAFSGVVWYQGESNTGRREGETYAALLGALMRGWRADLRESDLPFVVVQIADFNYRNDDDWRAVQRAQVEAVRRDPYARLVRSADISDANEIHPKEKGLLSARIVDAMLLFASSVPRASGDFTVRVNGRPAAVLAVPTPEPSNGGLDETNAFPYAFAPFELAEGRETVVEVRCSYAPLDMAQVLPASADVEVLRRGKDVLSLRVKSPRTFVVEPQGRHRALVLSPTRADPDAPKPGTAGVRYFGPGVHRPGEIRLGSNETLYLAPGAYVDGWLQADGTNMTVAGAGVLSGARWKWIQGPQMPGKVNRSGQMARFSGQDITIRDVTFFSSWCWTLVLNAVTNVTVDNVKVLGGRVINDDGIDICRAHRVTVRNSFVRCQDDCITPKYWCTDLVCTNLTLWTDSANVFRAGYECEKGSTGLVYDNHLYKDIDILHLSLRKRPPEDYWANCAISLQPSNDQLLKNFVFEDLRFHEIASNDVFLLVKTMPTTTAEPRLTAGFFQGLTLRNIHLPPCEGAGPCVFLQTHDDRHWIRDVRFDDVTGYGPVIRRGAVDTIAPSP